MISKSLYLPALPSSSVAAETLSQDPVTPGHLAGSHTSWGGLSCHLHCGGGSELESARDMDPTWTCWSPCQTLLSAQGQHCCGLGITAIIPKNPSRARAQGNRLQQYLFLYKSLQNMGTPLLSPAPSPPKPQPQPEGNRGMDSCQGSGPKHAIFSCFSQINVSAAEKLITKSCPSHRVPRGITTPHYLTSF